MSTATPSPARSSTETTSTGGPLPVLLVGGPVLLSTGVQLAVFGTGMFVASQEVVDAPEGVRAAVVSVSVVAGVAALVAVAVALLCRRDAGRARIGAIVLGAAALVALPAFWSGAPAILGATAAWLGGLARGGHRQTGAARGFAVVGLVVAVLDAVAVLVLTIGDLVANGYHA